jgi:hypothetical protein
VSISHFKKLKGRDLTKVYKGYIYVAEKKLVFIMIDLYYLFALIKFLSFNFLTAYKITTYKLIYWH